MSEHAHITEALTILAVLGLPRAQQNERSALCLLALLDLKPDQAWSKAGNPLVGITPMMDFSRDQYGKHYAPNSRGADAPDPFQRIAFSRAIHPPMNSPHRAQ